MIIVFNGPPRSGKDQSCHFLVERGFEHLSFKKLLFEKTIEYYGVDEGWFMEGYEDRSVKERKEEKLDNLSRRDAMIFVSEKVYKPKYGSDIFGVECAKNIEVGKDYCFSDGGFSEEIMPIINKCGTENICLVQLTRDGCDFSTDSRRYLNGNLVEEFVINHKTPIEKSHILSEKFAIRTYRIHNNGNVHELYESIERICQKEKNASVKEACSS